MSQKSKNFEDFTGLNERSQKSRDSAVAVPREGLLGGAGQGRDQQRVLKGLKQQKIGCGIKKRLKATLRGAGSSSENWETAAVSNGAQSGCSRVQDGLFLLEWAQ